MGCRMIQTGKVQHIFIVGAKSLGAYGGYETFVNKLTEYHQNNQQLKYHIACKANGDGCMNEMSIEGVSDIKKDGSGRTIEFSYHGARCFKINIPNIGAAQAIYYDVAALKNCCEYIKKNQIEHPIIYILACRIGPFVRYFKKKIQELGGEMWINPDGHEFLRKKWSAPIRKYWKISERLMVKYADYIICDSTNIEKYINETYKRYDPKTTYIAYGAETRKSSLKENDDGLKKWYDQKGLTEKEYYLVVGRFVPENNYEIMIREFMNSHSKKNFAIITNVNEKFLEELEQKLHFQKDPRIKFVGTVYEQELLMKIRENAYGYFHGHEVGGTNPSLLEALGSTELNLLLDVGFNREVAEDAALYWNKEEGNLAKLIDTCDQLDEQISEEYGIKAKKRIETAYSWTYISKRYEEEFLKKSSNNYKERS